VPLLVLANKQDLPDASSEKDISEVLGLARIKERDWAIFKCSAVTGTGLNESLDWLVERLTPLI
jgi:ADP-ribosylation factor-like protein 1